MDEEVVAVRRGAARSVVTGLAGLAGAVGLLCAAPGAAAAAGAVGPEPGGPAAAAAAAPEADVAYHGRVALARGELRVWLVPWNEGPSELPDSTVRLRLSAELADRQDLAAGCVRAGAREVVCETGPLPRHGQGRHIGLVLGLKEPVPEVVVRIDTWWDGGAADRNLANNQHAVLALDTGDTYAF
ncbi:hypothetical protein [Streptomyces sp. WAC05292]|uniref:hypothetical protein n=1 Tax=Streptomyces sp. WAC05292 TaxID=2487418 RepID=UPI0021AFFC14|nr:hypothetical protein [Streptomyces sp. WAC05292]